MWCGVTDTCGPVCVAARPPPLPKTRTLLTNRCMWACVLLPMLQVDSDVRQKLEAVGLHDPDAKVRTSGFTKSSRGFGALAFGFWAADATPACTLHAACLHACLANTGFFWRGGVLSEYLHRKAVLSMMILRGDSCSTRTKPKAHSQTTHTHVSAAGVDVVRGSACLRACMRNSNKAYSLNTHPPTHSPTHVHASAAGVYIVRRSACLHACLCH